MHRDAVVDHRADLLGIQRRLDPLSVRVARDVEVVDVRARGRLVGDLHELAQTGLAIPTGDRTALLVPRVHPRVEDTDRGGLKVVESGVVANLVKDDLVVGAVEAKAPNPLGERLIATGDKTPIADSGEVLCREEAKGRDVAERPHLTVDRGGTETLGAVLDDREAVSCRDGHDLWHVGDVAEDVDRDDGFGAWRDPRLNRLRVDAVAQRLDIDEYGDRADAGDRLGGCVERVRRRDDLVTGADVERLKRDHERVRAVGHTHAGPPKPFAERGLERGDVRPQDEAARVEDIAQCDIQLAAEWGVLRLYVHEWNTHQSERRR